MAIAEVPNRTLFEAFHADTRFADLRDVRSKLQPPMQVLRENVTGFREGKTTLKPESIQRLREYILQMLQLQHAMIKACEIIPAEFEPVKNKILADFDTDEPKAYLQQVNGWLRVIDGNV
ncbi:hypothetical protein ABH908_000500 [Pseudomonas frederiksbergensis]|uniref:hypothetical protein n=1 Tax=Pseudomonas TaxID=286 RepID=UPI003D252C87